MGAGRFGKAWKAFQVLTGSPIWGPQDMCLTRRPVCGVVLSPALTPSLPTERCLISSLPLLRKAWVRSGWHGAGRTSQL